jgi:TusA-related sulfurtransferase
MTAALTIDARGKRCPLPIIEVAQKISQVQIGEEILLLADDPAAKPDLIAWARMTGHAYVGSAGDEHRIIRSH